MPHLSIFLFFTLLSRLSNAHCGFNFSLSCHGLQSSLIQTSLLNSRNTFVTAPTCCSVYQTERFLLLPRFLILAKKPCLPSSLLPTANVAPNLVHSPQAPCLYQAPLHLHCCFFNPLTHSGFPDHCCWGNFSLKRVFFF